MAEQNHVHTDIPGRCCEEQSAAEVLARLRDSRPERQGGMTPAGWKGESEASYAGRLAAWQTAVAREEGRAANER